MITTLAIGNYRSLLNLIMPMGQLNVITGANASGKSNLYKSLRLLSETAQGGVIAALAREGGLSSTFWAGPEKLSKRMLSGEVPVQGGPKQKVSRLRLGFYGENYGYSIALGLPTPSRSAFMLDPEIKRETIWAGDCYHPKSALIDRQNSLVKSRNNRQWHIISEQINNYESIFSHISDPQSAPEVFHLKQHICQWRFYDHFRTDDQSPARQPQLGTRTTILHHDGRDLAAALQTILEIGNHDRLHQAITDAFPGSRLKIARQNDNRFLVELHQEGLLRPLTAQELSDGTLRYLLWVAALLTPRPPPLMVLNEPETSLHPDLLPALAKLIVNAAQSSQVWVVSHSNRLINALESYDECQSIRLEKQLGSTQILGQDILSTPLWKWSDHHSYH